MCWLCAQNCGQGLGFTLGARVINRKTLTHTAVTLATSFTALYATLMALAESPTDAGLRAGGSEICELSGTQVAGIRAAMLGRNASCAYNMSVASAIGA